MHTFAGLAAAAGGSCFAHTSTDSGGAPAQGTASGALATLAGLQPTATPAVVYGLT
jgi:hypothetical protein